MKTVASIAELRAWLAPSRTTGTIGLVPTMGALHDGHVSLFRAARSACDVVVASLFVNPAQFGEAADLAAYPREEARDRDIARESGVDVLFAPSRVEMYPAGFATWIEPAGAACGLEGAHRPGHFRGVATVVTKLLMIVRPDVVFFGQKDVQQAAVVAQTIRDLNIDVEMRVVPTVRDADGVALSSRNARLSADERMRAQAIPRALGAARSAHRAGGDPVAAARACLDDRDTEYVAVADFAGRPTLAVAVRYGATRLIDNVSLEDEREGDA